MLGMYNSACLFLFKAQIINIQSEWYISALEHTVGRLNLVCICSSHSHINKV